MIGPGKPLRPAIGSLVVALLPFTVSTARVKVESKSEAKIDWRKVAAISTALGSPGSLGQDTAARWQEDGGGVRFPTSEPDVQERWEMVQTLIVSTLGGHQHLDAHIAENFLEIARQFRQEDGDLTDRMCQYLKFMGLKRPSEDEEQWWTRVFDPAEYAGDSSSVETSGGTRGARSRSRSGDVGAASVLKRYRANEPRGPDEVPVLEKLLRDVKRPSDGTAQPPFLRLFARSSSGDPSKELMVTYEPVSTSLREYFGEHDVPLVKRLAMFFDILVDVADLYRKGIRHNGIACPDNVIVATASGVAADGEVSLAKATFCPSIFSAELQVCSTQDGFWPLLFGTDEGSGLPPSGSDAFFKLMKADIQQLGDLLDWLVRTAPDALDTDILPFGVLANAMREGIFNRFEGSKGIVWEFAVVAMAKTMMIAYNDAVASDHDDAPHLSGSAFGESDFTIGLFEHALENPMEPSSAFLHNLNKAIMSGSSVGHHVLMMGFEPWEF